MNQLEKLCDTCGKRHAIAFRLNCEICDSPAQMPDITRETIRATASKLQKEVDELILSTVERIIGYAPTVEEIVRHGTINTDTFGNRTVYWDGQIILGFPKHTPTVAEYDRSNPGFKVEQPYQLYV